MERNIRLDYFRIILSLLVITVHTQSLFSNDSLTGWLISNGICRVAVPCFFLIRGYYLHFGYYHLWYLPALLLGILMLLALKKFIKNNNLLLVSGILLYITGYILENCGLPYRVFCNGIFFGFPFIVLGYYIQKMGYVNVKSLHLYIILFISLITLLLESYQGYKTNIYHNLFLSLYILCPLLIICIQKRAKYNIEKYDISKLAAGIYFVHILVAGQIIPIAETNNIYRLPFIMIVSVLLAIFIVLIDKRIKILL